MNAITMNGFKRISKQQASELFNDGQSFYIQLCNRTPANPWQYAMEINSLKYLDESWSFDGLVNNFEYYNLEHEREYCASFYIRA